MSMKAPYREPLLPAEPGPRVVPEPRRRGEEGGGRCGVCAGSAEPAVWGDEHFTLHPPRTCSLPGTLWLASRDHVDSFRDLSSAAAAGFGPLVARVETAMLEDPGVGRVHVYRWGDGAAHFHVWMMPRPLGMLEASGMMLPLWEDALPDVPDEECRTAARRVVDRLAG
ncbi:hypothetical protein [Nocardioides currus]|uniref:HIT family protein n=1 Tax=Nocardioides currus TaxID=2133958 RepID=A0A2R7Z252_9ACTN|nr:hypothetical protein [Nocardioides currus]PUA82326.1 hypothetical protein C7S10_00795 [Nocardioides currus]